MAVYMGSESPYIRDLNKYTRQKTHVYRVIILKQMANHTFELLKTKSRNMADTLRKREVKPPKRFVTDFSSHRSQVGAKRKAAKTDKTLYEIEIIDIDKVQDKVKIHYKGYGSEFDEWRSCVELGLPIRLEKLRLPGEDSFEDRYNSFYDSLYRDKEETLFYLLISSMKNGLSPRELSWKSLLFVFSSLGTASATRTSNAQEIMRNKANFTNIPTMSPTANYCKPQRIWYQNTRNVKTISKTAGKFE